MRLGRHHLAAACLAIAATTACLPFPSVLPRSETSAPATRGERGSRTIAIRWNHPDPASVEHFRIYWGLEAREYVTYLDVGKPASEGGVFETQVLVPEGLTIYVALTAIGPGGESAPSNLGVCRPDCIRARPTTTPPEPRRSAPLTRTGPVHPRQTLPILGRCAIRPAWQS